MGEGEFAGQLRPERFKGQPSEVEDEPYEGRKAKATKHFEEELECQ